MPGAGRERPSKITAVSWCSPPGGARSEAAPPSIPSAPPVASITTSSRSQTSS